MVRSEQFLSRVPRDTEGIEAILDRRDKPAFDREWQQAYDRVGRIDVGSAQIEIDTIRELAFRASFAKAESADLAGYVCDDFELIVRCRLVGGQDPFVERLWSAYGTGELPCT